MSLYLLFQTVIVQVKAVGQITQYLFAAERVVCNAAHGGYAFFVYQWNEIVPATVN